MKLGKERMMQKENILMVNLVFSMEINVRHEKPKKTPKKKKDNIIIISFCFINKHQIYLKLLLGLY